ncbi:MAG: Cas10/Cmr2 second palm domain-containing protein [Ignavibacteriaceae bacterium]
MGENKGTCIRCKSLPAVVKAIERKNDSQGKLISEIYDLCPLCFLKLRAHKLKELNDFSDIEDTKPYPPIAAITTKELAGNYPSVYDKIYKGETQELEKNLFTRKGPNGEDICDLKTYHSYISIVQADGDELGKIISKLNSPSLLSVKLFEFAKQVDGLNSKYGVEPIFLGGDDILVFMPVVFNGETVIDYILELRDLYVKIINVEGTTPSISFGVGISYYKYPMSFALEDTRNLLFEKAKNEPGKNSLILQLTQHSGARTSIKFSFKEDILDKFNIFLKEVINSEKSGKPLHPHALHHKLSRFKTLLTSVNNVQQINEFFINEFNEPVHKTLSGLKTIKELLLSNISTKDDMGNIVIFPKDELAKQFDNFLAQIKFIKFLIGD